MKRAIATYASDGQEELLEVALPLFKRFAHEHGYDVVHDMKLADTGLPPAWTKILILRHLLQTYEQVLWLDADLVITDFSEDLPILSDDKSFAMVRHFANMSEVPNTGVWLLRRDGYCETLLDKALELEVFKEHPWWEQAAVLTMLGYAVPHQGADFAKARCRRVQRTPFYNQCQFMRLEWNSHPEYRAAKPRIVHCSYQDMPLRLETMRALARDHNYEYPRW